MFGILGTETEIVEMVYPNNLSSPKLKARATDILVLNKVSTLLTPFFLLVKNNSNSST